MNQGDQAQCRLKWRIFLGSMWSTWRNLWSFSIYSGETRLFFVAWILLCPTIDLQIMSFGKLWRCWQPAVLRQEKSCSPLASTIAPHGYWCVSQRLVPRRTTTTIRTTLFDERSLTAVIDGEISQFPECTDCAASTWLVILHMIHIGWAN